MPIVISEGSDRMILMATTSPVLLERGKTWVFASALDWPGWCRRGKGEEAALDALMEYAPRYKKVIGRGFVIPDLSVVEKVNGNATTDFGAPSVSGIADQKRLSPAAAESQLRCLQKSWTYFDKVVKQAPAALRKGPRGGGRDRDAIVDHVREAERAYGRKVGARVPPRTLWPEQRTQISAALISGAKTDAWTARYAIRRIAWHVLDHAWEIEDRSQT